MKITKHNHKLSILLALVLLIISANFAQAQTTTQFTYQGKLTNNSMPANGNYDFEFRLYSDDIDCCQLGATQTSLNVPVSNGVFTVIINFGAQFDGSRSWLEIKVRQIGMPSYTTLTPRQEIMFAPQSMHSLRATIADDSLRLGGVLANLYALKSDPRFTDSRNPLAGSGNYLQNTATQQSGVTNFNISGNGTTGGTLSGNVVNSATQYNIGGNRVLSTPGTNNLFAGINAGSSDTGFDNSFFGANAGITNSGVGNSFFGADTGGNCPSSPCPLSLTGSNNSFFGVTAGYRNTTGFRNSFFGASAGGTNTTGGGNTIIGSDADVGTNNLTNATAIGARAIVAQSNSLVLGSINTVNSATADTKVGIGTTAPTATLNVVTSSTNAADNTATFAATNIGPNQSHIHYGANGDWFIRSAAVAGKVVLQDTGGSVAIGTSTPKAKLDVTGGNILVGTPGQGIILKSPNGATCKLLSIDNAGAMALLSIACP